MYGRDQWGGSFEINAESATEDNRSRTEIDSGALSRQLDETQQSWLLGPGEKKKTKYLDLGCVVVSYKVVKWFLWIFASAAIVSALAVLIAKTLPKHHQNHAPPDNYTVALHKALLFFNAQKSGVLPKNNNISWRGNSALQDGISDPSVSSSLPKKDLVGGYYDAGDQIKFGFPGAFTITMLSWSVIEYRQKYEDIGELNHIRDVIKWGTDYMLKTFNASAAKSIDVIFSQVGQAVNGSTTPDDHSCWMRPEDMDYARPVIRTTAGPDLAGEMAAALAAASIVFNDDGAYSKQLLSGADLLYKFARDGGKRRRYSAGNAEIAQFYNSTGYYDEYVWGAAWMYFASGNVSYLNLATLPAMAKHAGAFSGGPYYGVFSWDNKLPGAQVLLARLRIFLNPGYPYEDMLATYQNQTNIFMCSYLPMFNSFNRTKGGLIQLNHGNPQPLPFVVNAAFLASVYSDFLYTADIAGFNCGPNYFSRKVLRDFARFQVGHAVNGSKTPDDHYCWMRPEDMDYPRPVIRTSSGPDLAAEMAAALAAASIVFNDDRAYSKKLVRGADLLYQFARDSGKRSRYSSGNPEIAQFYNSSGYYDEYIWGAAWMYYATGNNSYLRLATLKTMAKHAGAFSGGPYYGVFSWDNKLPGAQVLLTRLRIFLSPGYPFEDMLASYHNQTNIVMCSYLPLFNVFNRTKGGLIQLNHGNPQPLQYVVNAAFLASVYSDYLNTADIPGFYCGPNYISREVLRNFARFQMDYILGKNPRKMSYIVGYGKSYPRHVHHRAASIPTNNVKYSCTGGYKWRDSSKPNPHVITGAMVAGPDKHDRFHDSRLNYNQTEPTIAGNAGLVAALVALSGGDNSQVDKNTLFSAVPPLFPLSPPPPSPWQP